MEQSRSIFCFEVCANSVESCIEAQKGGADRVELCCALEEGGLTPSYATIKEARNLMDIKIHVLVRPRGGDFLYTDNELNIMAEDIRQAVSLGVDGIVFGCLTSEGTIDYNATKFLKEAAGTKSVTFHRAFDCCKDAWQAVEQLIDLKIDRILTSGQQSSAEKGVPLLHELQEQYGSRIKFLAGCGINESNIAQIYNQTGIKEYHFSAREKRGTDMKFFNRNVFMGNPDHDDYSFDVTSTCKVQKTIKKLSNY